MKFPREPALPQPQGDSYLVRLVVRLTELFRAIYNALPTSGTYTPTATNISNVSASTMQTWNWIRVGNIVHVSGRCSIDPIAPGYTQIDVTLPVPSAITTGYECIGTGVSYTTTYGEPIAVGGGSGKAIIVFTAVSTANNPRWVHFTYRVV